MSLTHPWALSLSLAALIVLFLHHLRKRRVEVRVPSLALWREAVGEESARSRKTSLFDLPLVLLLASVLLASGGAAEPLVLSAGDSPRPVLLVLDCSASTIAGGAFDRARTAALELVRSLPPDTPVTVVEAGAAPRISCRKGSPAQAESALYAASPEETEGDPAEALRLASREDAGLRLFYTDRPVSVPASFRCLSFGEPMPNTGITAASIEREGLFLAVADYSAEPWKGKLVLRCGGSEAVAAALELRPMERRDLLLELRVPADKPFELALVPGDGFPVDDVLYVGRSGASAVTIAVAGRGLNPPSEKGILGALDSLEGVKVIYVEGTSFPRDLEADAFIGLRAAWPEGDAPALCFLPAGGSGPVASGAALSGGLEVIAPPHPFFAGTDGAPLAVERGRVTAGSELKGTAGWRPVLSCAGKGALFVAGDRWAAAFDPEFGPDCWCRDLTFALFVARFADRVRAVSRRPLLLRTDARHPRTGFRDGANGPGRNLLSDLESDLTRRAVKIPRVSVPDRKRRTVTGRPLGSWLFVAALGLFLLALALERRV